MKILCQERTLDGGSLKRKFKRIAIDSDSNASTSQVVAIMSTSTFGGKNAILFRNVALFIFTYLCLS